MIRPTSLTSVQFSRCSLSSASLPLSHCTKMSGRATPAGPARQHGHLSTQASTYMRLKRATQHGRVACAVVDIRRTNAVYGHAGIKSLQPRRWRGYRTHPRCHRRRHHPMAVADVGSCWCCTGRASVLATRFLRSSACVMASRFNVSCKTLFLNMWETVARAVSDLDGVLGFEVCCLTSSYLFSPHTRVAG
jgi:hypothetical protein